MRARAKYVNRIFVNSLLVQSTHISDCSKLSESHYYCLLQIISDCLISPPALFTTVIISIMYRTRPATVILLSIDLLFIAYTLTYFAIDLPLLIIFYYHYDQLSYFSSRTLCPFMLSTCFCHSYDLMIYSSLHTLCPIMLSTLGCTAFHRILHLVRTRAQVRSMSIALLLISL